MSVLLFEQDGAVAKITLNRPKVFNSFNREMAFALIEALEKCRDDQSIRAIYLTGEGRAFCAGQDLNEAIEDNGIGFDKILNEHYNPIVTLVRAIEKPIICAVNGVAAGAGANIALACDITFAGESASFIQAFSKIGLIPDSGGTYLLPRLVGMQRATAWMMLGEKVSAKDAADVGMIYKVVENEQLHETAYAIAKKLSTMPTLALGRTKRLLNHAFTNTYEQQLAEEAELQIISGETADYKEGTTAFLEKRKPVFKGE